MVNIIKRFYINKLLFIIGLKLQEIKRRDTSASTLSESDERRPLPPERL